MQTVNMYECFNCQNFMAVFLQPEGVAVRSVRPQIKQQHHSDGKARVGREKPSAVKTCTHSGI